MNESQSRKNSQKNGTIEFKTKYGTITKTVEEALEDNERLRIAKFIELALTDDKMVQVLQTYGDPVILIAMREWNYLLEHDALPIPAKKAMHEAPPNRRLSHLRQMLLGMENIQLDPKIYGYMTFDVYVLCDIFRKTVLEEFHE